MRARLAVVPRVVVGGSGGQGGVTGTNLTEGLLTMLLSERFGVKMDGGQPKERSPQAENLRSEIRRTLSPGESTKS